ncbi:FAD-binding oxidoreductase [Poseidonocella sp. HB161398]|uniref:NAD(P)/FAD-dependent oxidoreductase n=1 Tax=Poseidonocella sp. HB161398 TaxID=2320855 RepID=UPI001108385A|nr:FAD-dependent oxidoreductase [Poseidonocella sp. HB161398]
MFPSRDCIDRFPSLWMETARETDPARPLDGDTRADVAVIGAGFTGLGCAISLAEAGRDVVVLDGGGPGWGGSGRNSGAVIRGFKMSRSELRTTFGAEGDAIAEFGAKNAELVYALVARFGIDCALRRTGWIQPAHNAAGLRRVEERHRTWTADGVTGIEMLDRAQIARELGSEAYIGGLIDRGCAVLQPLDLVRGMARGAASLGARIHGGTPVTGYRREGGDWVVATPRGTVRAPVLVVATNAYTGGLEPGMAGSMLTTHTQIVATEPLPGAQIAAILPGGASASDSRRVLFYWNRSPDNRLVFGTRGKVGGPRSPGDFAHVEAALASVYPQLAGAKITHRWGGKVSLTRDYLPRLAMPAPDLWTAHGYSGRGVAMGTAYGLLMGEAIAAARPLQSLPVPHGAAPAAPPALLRAPGIAAATVWYRLLDRWM